MASILSFFLGRRRPGKETVIHFTGHRILADAKRSRFPRKRETAIVAAVRDVLRKEGVCAGVGGLASGADIVVAEALLARGAAVHIVLPCDRARFVALSVEEAGEDWVRRFFDVLRKADSLTELDPEGKAPDFRQSSDEAMALVARIAADREIGCFQFSLFDGRGDDNDEGTHADLEAAERAGWRRVMLTIPRRGKIRLMELD